MSGHQETSEEQVERWAREDRDFDERDMAETYGPLSRDEDEEDEAPPPDPIRVTLKLDGHGKPYWYQVIMRVDQGEETVIWNGDDWHDGQCALGQVRRALALLPVAVDEL